MKSNKNLYPEITNWHNLLLAWHKTRRGKRYTPASTANEYFIRSAFRSGSYPVNADYFNGFRCVLLPAP